jgi:A/G-specific adenine glycosylase
VAAIAFGLPANAVDGNVERVMARAHGVEAPLPGAKAELKALAGTYVTAERPGDWVQALMDLGATVCTPRSPKCSECPWRAGCAGFASGAPETYPRRDARPVRPTRRGAAFQLRREGRLWLVRRPDQGLLGGMAGLPTTPWREAAWTRGEILKFAPGGAAWKNIGAVRHVFTHFALTLDVWAGEGEPEGEGWWAAPDAFGALPTVFRKAASL